MKQIAVVLILLALIAAAGLWYALRPRPVEERLTPAQIQKMPFTQLFDLAGQCEAHTFDANCTLIFEVMALKSQHAKEGEKFWVTQMLRLGDWYIYAGTRDWKPGSPDAPEVKKALEVFDWVYENKPFYGDGALIGRARLYNSKYNPAWAAAHRAEAKDAYAKLQKRYPAAPYATEATAALNSLR